VAVIPARGGSRRIPRKNLRPFAGKPMIAHSIDRALESHLFDRVIVSTDDEEISQVATARGAEVPFQRPAALADDHATTLDVMQHAVGWLRANGPEPTTICCIYATAPFISCADLLRGLERFLAGDWLYVFSAAVFAYPVFRSFQMETDGGVRMLFPQHSLTRSQDLPRALHDAGQFYWGRPQAWLDRAAIFSARSAVVEIPHWRVQDIDTYEDWDRAEMIARLLDAQHTETT
jgi:N-acylneuraminate cytidylyltransferase